MRVIAVAARGTRAADVRRFVRQRFGDAPVAVYVDTTGSIAAAFGVTYHPVYRFVSAQGVLRTRPVVGFPFR